MTDDVRLIALAGVAQFSDLVSGTAGEAVWGRWRTRSRNRYSNWRSSSVEPCDRLARVTGPTLPPTPALDRATPRRPAVHLLEQSAGEDTVSAVTATGRLDERETESRALVPDDTTRPRLSSRVSALPAVVRGEPEAAPDRRLESAGTTQELLNLLDSAFGES